MAKSNRKLVLGRGLSAILNDPDNLTKSINDKNEYESIGKIIDLPLENIITNPTLYAKFICLSLKILHWARVFLRKYFVPGSIKFGFKSINI